MAKFKKCPKVLKSRSKDTHIIFHDAPILAASVYFRKVDMIFASKAANSRSGKNTAVCIHHLRCYFRRCSSSAGSTSMEQAEQQQQEEEGEGVVGSGPPAVEA